MEQNPILTEIEAKIKFYIVSILYWGKCLEITY